MHIYGKRVNEEEENTGEYQMILATGLTPVKLIAPITEEYALLALEDKIDETQPDTDEDGLPDYKEVNFGCNLIKFENGIVTLPTYGACVNYKSELTYVERGLNRLDDVIISDRLFLDYVYETVKVLPIVSDPTSEDGDNDGVTDKYDYNKLIPDGEIKVFSTNNLPRWDSKKNKFAEDMEYSDLDKEDLQKKADGKLKNYIDKDEETLIKKMKEQAWPANKEGQNAYKRMVDHFITGNGTDFSDDYVTTCVLNNNTTQSYIKNVEKYVKEEIIENDGLLYKMDFNKLPENKNNLYRNIQETNRPKADNVRNGVVFCVNDTWGNYVYVTDYKFDGINFSGTIKFKIFDHFGVDENDIISHGESGFRSWYVLQHYDKFDGKYRPYVNWIETSIEFEGSLYNDTY